MSTILSVMLKQEHDWIAKKGIINKHKHLQLICARCGKEFERPKWYHELCMQNNKGRGPFCSHRCALIARNVSEEQRRRVSESQIGVSVPSRGKKGHMTTEETREKIRQSKLGVPCKNNHYDLVVKELALRQKTKYAITKGTVPDAIFIEDGKLVALEVENKICESDTRRKMKSYDNNSNGYDKVILVWYNPRMDNNRVKEWILENGEWSVSKKEGEVKDG